ncbi:MAG: hypothetical protein J5647_10540 [Spirochaetaceae bacterium]|nr:hypothetical protein [Spirochaetaceae bacterium]
MAVFADHPMTRKIKLFALAVLLTVQLSNLFSKSLEERIADFSNLSGKEQVDTLIELYSNNINFGRRVRFAEFVHIIIGNTDDTCEYILQKFKNTKPVPYEQAPFDFEILITLLEYGRSPNSFFKSEEDYKNSVYELYKLKMDEYLNDYHVIDIRYKLLYDYVCSMETGKKHITTLEDLPGLLEELTAQGYEDLTINTEHIYSRNKN